MPLHFLPIIRQHFAPGTTIVSDLEFNAICVKIWNGTIEFIYHETSATLIIYPNDAILFSPALIWILLYGLS